MAYYQPEEIRKAKEMDLYTYLKNYEPDELVHFSRDTYMTRTHDSLKISNGMWYWFSRGIGGKTALEYLIQVREYTFIQAVETILGYSNDRPPIVYQQPKKVQNVRLILPKKSTTTDKVMSYLIGRGIDKCSRYMPNDFCPRYSHIRAMGAGRLRSVSNAFCAQGMVMFVATMTSATWNSTSAMGTMYGMFSVISGNRQGHTAMPKRHVPRMSAAVMTRVSAVRRTKCCWCCRAIAPKMYIGRYCIISSALDMFRYFGGTYVASVMYAMTNMTNVVSSWSAMLCSRSMAGAMSAYMAMMTNSVGVNQYPFL